MEPEQRAQREEQIAAVQEATEQRMHETANLMPNGDALHRRADRISEWARGHLERARYFRRRARGSR